MKTVRSTAVKLAGAATLALLSLGLGGCATYYSGGDRGVYYEVPQYRPGRAVYVDPFVYPYWSLDYFYYSRYYHPFSVVVHRYDPWYYPYPGWYYGYWPGPRFAGHPGRVHYPWYRFGHRYPGFRPWRASTRVAFGDVRRHDSSPRARVRQLDERLREFETRRSLALRDQAAHRQLMPGAAPWLPASSRSRAVRRGDSAPPRPGGRGSETSARGSAAQRALIERLRAAPRGALPERGNRASGVDRRPVAPPPMRDIRPRRETGIEPAPPVRQRPISPAPPRGQPQRRPVSEPSRPTRPAPRPRRDEPTRHERR